jgi:hypothetical protein
MRLAFLGNALLRTAITQNLVSFPSQIRPFTNRRVADLQVRVVQLYFVRGWSVRRIRNRYNISNDIVNKLLAQWRTRAIECGFIQEIEPDDLAAIVPGEPDTDDADSEPLPVYKDTPRREPRKAIYIPAVQASMPTHGTAVLVRGEERL